MFYSKNNMIYQPEQDSHMLAKQIQIYLGKLKNKNIKVLDMGSGSGIQAQTVIKAGVPKKNVLCADINPEAIEFLEKQKLNAVHSNLFSKIKTNFDLITFNPPYLPENKYDKLPDTTAGKKGYETITEFLKQAKAHLNKDGTILLLFSSLSKPNIILKEAKALGYKFELLAEENAGMMEKLFVYKFK